MMTTTPDSVETGGGTSVVDTTTHQYHSEHPLTAADYVVTHSPTLTRPTSEIPLRLFAITPAMQPSSRYLILALCPGNLDPQHTFDLHWGVGLSSPDEWVAPPCELMPPQATQVETGVATTRFEPIAGNKELLESLPWLDRFCEAENFDEENGWLFVILPFTTMTLRHKIQSVQFVLHRLPSGTWIKRHGHRNFLIDVPHMIGVAETDTEEYREETRIITTIVGDRKVLERWHIELGQRTFKLLAYVDTTPDYAEIILVSNDPHPLTLHWGALDPVTQQWKAVCSSDLLEIPEVQNPYMTVIIDEQAAQTKFEFPEPTISVQQCRIRIAAAGVPTKLMFVLKETASQTWHSNAGRDFAIDMPQDEAWVSKQQEALTRAEEAAGRARQRRNEQKQRWQTELQTFIANRPTREQDSDVTFASFVLQDGIGVVDCSVLAEENSEESLWLVVEIVACLQAPCLLHWGCVGVGGTIQRKKTGAWLCPPKHVRPAGSRVIDPRMSVQTPFMAVSDSIYSLTIRFPAKRTPVKNPGDFGLRAEFGGVAFVLKEVEGSRWIKASDGRDLVVRTYSSVTDSWTGPRADTVSTIVDAEVEWDHMTLMHRYNLCHGMIDQELRDYHNHLVSKKESTAFWSWIFVWNRFSFLCWLDWQRNYNTKPRDLAGAANSVSCKMAKCWKELPEFRTWTRLTLATMGRGGSAGQAIRDRILDIMHKHKIPETGRPGYVPPGVYYDWLDEAMRHIDFDDVSFDSYSSVDWPDDQTVDLHDLPFLAEEVEKGAVVEGDAKHTGEEVESGAVAAGGAVDEFRTESEAALGLKSPSHPIHSNTTDESATSQFSQISPGQTEPSVSTSETQKPTGALDSASVSVFDETRDTISFYTAHAAVTSPPALSSLSTPTPPNPASTAADSTSFLDSSMPRGVVPTPSTAITTTPTSGHTASTWHTTTRRVPIRRHHHGHHHKPGEPRPEVSPVMVAYRKKMQRLSRDCHGKIAGHFYEQWHQKLHNNTTPDDIPICTALIRYLETGGNIHEYWNVLHGAGITREKLASYERPVTKEPFMPHCDIGGLIWDFKQYLDILKEVHDALDLQKSAARIRHMLSYERQSQLDGILWESGIGQPHSFDQACDRIGRIHLLRRHVIDSLNSCKLDDGTTRDLLLFDFSLETVQSLLLQGCDKSGAPWRWMELLGWFIDIVAQHRPIRGHEEWQALAADWFSIGMAAVGNRWTGDQRLNALMVKALMDRLTRAVGTLTDVFQEELGPKAQHLGMQVDIDKQKLFVFVDEVLRGSVLFAISLCIKYLEPHIRAWAQLPPWQMISMVHSTRGVLQSVAELTNIQDKLFEIPTILISDAVNGEEEIPTGVQAVLVRSASAAPDILSHVAVRARNCHVLLAVCFDSEIMKQWETQYQNQWVTLTLTHGGTELAIAPCPEAAAQAAADEEGSDVGNSLRATGGDTAQKACEETLSTRTLLKSAIMMTDGAGELVVRRQTSRAFNRQTTQNVIDRVVERQSSRVGLLRKTVSLQPEMVDLRRASTKFVISVGEFDRDQVGSKSMNLKILKQKIPSMNTPRAFAFPYGSMGKVLAASERNLAIRKKMEKVLIDLGLLTANNQAREIFDQVRNLMDNIEPPAEMEKYLGSQWDVIEAANAGNNSGIVGKTLRELFTDSTGAVNWKAIVAVWQSVFAMRPWLSLAKANRNFCNLSMAVLAQELMPADYAFVLHTKNPFANEELLGNRKEMYGEIVVGLGEVLVANYPGRALSWKMVKGSGQPEIVAFPAKSQALIAQQCLIFRSDSNGEDLDGFAGAGLFESIPAIKPKLETVVYNRCRLVTDHAWRHAMLKRIADASFAIEDAFGQSMDIEGVVCGEQLVIVQARPQV